METLSTLQHRRSERTNTQKHTQSCIYLHKNSRQWRNMKNVFREKETASAEMLRLYLKDTAGCEWGRNGGGVSTEEWKSLEVLCLFSICAKDLKRKEWKKNSLDGLFIFCISKIFFHMNVSVLRKKKLVFYIIYAFWMKYFLLLFLVFHTFHSVEYSHCMCKVV